MQCVKLPLNKMAQVRGKSRSSKVTVEKRSQHPSPGVMPTMITMITGVCSICRDDKTSRSAPPESAGSLTPSEYVSTLNDTKMEELIRVLTRRVQGRAAILNTPTVVRALTASKRHGQRVVKERRDFELAKVS